MFRTSAEHGRSVPLIDDPRVGAVLKRGAIWDEWEFILLRGALAQARSPAVDARIRALLRDFECAANEHAA